MRSSLTTKLFSVVVLIAALFGAASAADDGTTIAGYLYTTTNGEGVNEVVRLARYSDGSLGDEKTYRTHGKGASDHSAPAHGDYDAQGALKIIGNFLLTTNSGSDSISVFRLDRSNGELEHVGNSFSNGQFPVTLAYAPVKGNDNAYWVAVGNQWGTPTVLYDGADLRRYPNDAFFKQDLTKADISDDRRNVQLYKLHADTGELEYIRMIAKYNRQNGGPAAVNFSPDGTKIGVTTWGVPHFFSESPILEETRPSRTYVYDFNPETGKVKNSRYYEEDGVIGAVGFEWSAKGDTLYISNFNLIKAKDDHGLVVLHDDGKSITKVSNHVTGMEHDIDEACWTALSPAKDMLYVVSYVTNVITSFKLDVNTGKVVERAQVVKREGDDPHEDAKDIYITPDGKHMYGLGAFVTYSISKYDLAEDGTFSYGDRYVLERTKSEAGNPGIYDLGGIDGFSIK